jgi:hypothetical protein
MWPIPLMMLLPLATTFRLDPLLRWPFIILVRLLARFALIFRHAPLLGAMVGLMNGKLGFK